MGLQYILLRAERGGAGVGYHPAAKRRSAGLLVQKPSQMVWEWIFPLFLLVCICVYVATLARNT
jgi:hypothetical protein